MIDFKALQQLLPNSRIFHEQLGKLGGNSHFQEPEQDAVAQEEQGVAPTTEHVAIYPWWYWL